MNLDLGLAAFGNEAAVYFERQHASSRVTLYLPWPDWTQSPCPAWEQGDLSCPSGFHFDCLLSPEGGKLWLRGLRAPLCSQARCLGSFSDAIPLLLQVA